MDQLEFIEQKLQICHLLSTVLSSGLVSFSHRAKLTPSLEHGQIQHP